MEGRAYKRLVDNRVQSLKLVFGKKPLGQLILASNILELINYVILLMKTTENKQSYILGEKRDIKKILVTLVNILKSYSIMQLQVDKTLKKIKVGK